MLEQNTRRVEAAERVLRVPLRPEAEGPHAYGLITALKERHLQSFDTGLLSGVAESRAAVVDTGTHALHVAQTPDLLPVHARADVNGSLKRAANYDTINKKDKKAPEKRKGVLLEGLVFDRNNQRIVVVNDRKAPLSEADAVKIEDMHKTDLKQQGVDQGEVIVSPLSLWQK